MLNYYKTQNYHKETKPEKNTKRYKRRLEWIQEMQKSYKEKQKTTPNKYTEMENNDK